MSKNSLNEEGKVMYTSNDKLAQVISDDYRLLQVMSRFGISLGYGDKTIEEICGRFDVDTDTFLCVLNYVKNGSVNKTQKIDDVRLETLLSYLKKTHQYFLDYQLPTIRRKLIGAIDCSMKNEIAFLVLKFYDEYVEEVRKHMNSEENGVFSFVEKLINGVETLDDADKEHMLSRHHETIERRLKELKRLFMQYYPQTENDNELISVILEIYRTEEELQTHCMIEDNIFAPAVRQYERLIKQKKGSKPKDSAASTTNGKEDQLSQRERDIVISVAKGFSNKEIADTLCLSINTVTTHRRNIAKKLQIHSAAGIAIYAIVNKLVRLDEVNV